MLSITSNQKKSLIVILVALISVWHYSTNVHHPVLHILHRELYLVPVVLAAYWFGKKGGLTASVISSLLFLPWVFMSHEATFTNQLNNALELLTFNGVAYLLGIYRDAHKARYTTFWRPEAEKPAAQPHQRNVLLVIDNSANAAKTSRYVADNFARDRNMEVTILGFIREPSEDLFANSDEFTKAKKDSEENITALVDDAQKALLSGGFPRGAISVKIARIRKETIASKLMEVQKNDPYDTIVVGGVRLTKPEEFIFGNLAVKLVRESSCPVVTVF
jgi:nucleotide-binding universal stress UspA family protein